MFETDRLFIRHFTVDDAPFMLELLNTPAWFRFIGDRGVRTLKEARLYIENGPLKSYEQFGFGPYLVGQKSDNQSVGLCGLFKRDGLDAVDIGFGFLPDYEGKGYGYESASAVMNYADNQLKMNRITGLVLPTNLPSIRLLEKLGLRYEKNILFRSDGVENMLFGVTLSN
ncbi:GNAT family N-acetyltransferase [Spirosoma daeguense]